MEYLTTLSIRATTILLVLSGFVYFFIFIYYFFYPTIKGVITRKEKIFSTDGKKELTIFIITDNNGTSFCVHYHTHDNIYSLGLGDTVKTVYNPNEDSNINLKSSEWRDPGVILRPECGPSLEITSIEKIL